MYTGCCLTRSFRTCCSRSFSRVNFSTSSMFSVFLFGAISSTAMWASFSLIAARIASCLSCNEQPQNSLTAPTTHTLVQDQSSHVYIFELAMWKLRVWYSTTKPLALTEAHRCKQLAQNRYPAMRQPGVEHTISRSWVRYPNHSTTKPANVKQKNDQYQKSKVLTALQENVP